MRKTSRAVLIDEDEGRIALIERYRQGEHFFALPGGELDEGEDPEAGVLRELAEETSLNAEVVRQLYELTDPNFGHIRVFLCRYISGEIGLSPDAEEHERNRRGEDTVYPVWSELGRLASIRLLPESLASQLIADLDEGWADQVIVLKENEDSDK